MGEKVSKFTNLRLDYSSHELKTLVDQELDKLNDLYDQLEQIPLEESTFHKIVVPMSLSDARSQRIIKIATFLQNVSPSEEIRETSRELEKKISDFVSDSLMRSKLYRRLKYIDIYERDKLDELDTQLLDSIMSPFICQGIERSKKDRKHLANLNQRLSHLIIDFEKNLSEDQSYIILSTKDLIGCNDKFLQNTMIPNQPGYHRVEGDNVMPVLVNCEIEESRRLVSELEDSRCQENLKILEELHQVRTAIARANGYSYSSNYRLSGETIGTSRNVIRFIDRVIGYLNEHTKKYVEELKELKTEMSQEDKIEFHGHDYAYYHNKYLEKHYHVNHDLISEYFPADHVVTEMLKFYGELFHLKFTKSDQGSFSTWHPDVMYYQVTDLLSGKNIGGFYMDLYSRDSKFNHYAMWDLVVGYQEVDGTQVLPVAAMVGSFPSSDREEIPSLLQHSEVATLFHEFGHIIHGICGGYQNKYWELGGTNVERDYVEAPSQMKELWVWEPLVLQRISKHYQIGEILPDITIDNLIRSRYIGSACEWSQVAIMAKIDQLIHRKRKLNSEQMMNIVDTITEEVLDQKIGSSRRLASWGHIGSYGYDSLYYSYLWTMVIASDLYSKFKDNPINSDVGLEYRRKILEPGGTKSGWEMIKDFLGRRPSLEAFLNDYLGIDIDENNDDLSLRPKRKRRRT